jgi:hypothetical protein
MTSAHGQILRRIGLVIEALCMLGLLGLARGRVDIWNGFPIDPSRFLTISLGIGLLLWVAGTVAIYSGRKRPDDR